MRRLGGGREKRGGEEGRGNISKPAIFVIFNHFSHSV